jgi:hypothetical protein
MTVPLEQAQVNDGEREDQAGSVEILRRQQQVENWGWKKRDTKQKREEWSYYY